LATKINAGFGQNQGIPIKFYGIGHHELRYRVPRSVSEKISGKTITCGNFCHSGDTNMEPKINIGITKELYDKIHALMEEQGFSSVDEYVEFVMGEFLGEFRESHDSPGISEAEEKLVKERLRSLGYLE
jgi:hypothetical protein